jgi:hypothetical protein
MIGHGERRWRGRAAIRSPGGRAHGTVARMKARFVPGLELARRLYQAMRPVLGDLPHAAALLGPGSEVLGFDTARSADHDWGPRLQVFLRPGDVERHAARIREKVPAAVAGHPTGPGGGVVVTDAGTWLGGHLGFDPWQEVGIADWLATPAQRLAEITGGAVFHDGIGELTAARAALAWYPHDLWLHVLACQWRRVSQEEAFAGRCDEVGDGLGAAVVAARLVRDLMRLCLLMDRRYPPYAKWLGSAFARTPDAAGLTPSLTGALAATSGTERERHLVRAYETVAAAHNRLGLTTSVDPATRPYHDRPFQVLHAERFAEALAARVADPAVRRLPVTGAADQFLDSTDALGSQELTRGAVQGSLTYLARNARAAGASSR